MSHLLLRRLIFAPWDGAVSFVRLRWSLRSVSEFVTHFDNRLSHPAVWALGDNREWDAERQSTVRGMNLTSRRSGTNIYRLIENHNITTADENWSHAGIFRKRNFGSSSAVLLAKYSTPSVVAWGGVNSTQSKPQLEIQRWHRQDPMQYLQTTTIARLHVLFCGLNKRWCLWR